MHYMMSFSYFRKWNKNIPITFRVQRQCHFLC